jgi:hypothetical protein
MELFSQFKGNCLSGHPDPLAIGADPGGAIADSPGIFFKAVITDLKTAGTTPTELLFFLAAVTLIFAEFSSSVA